MLKHPASLGERTITELNLQEPRVEHMVRTDGKDISSVGADIALLSALSGEPESLLAKIHLEDWAEIRGVLQKVYAIFFGITVEDRQVEENPTKAAL